MQIQTISSRIHEIRGVKVILDYDLAILYEVETRALKQAVKRNSDRFPNDFMFILTENEIVALVSQNVTPSRSHLGGSKPFAFTEQGVAMMSGVLKSKKAIQIHIEIMRAFVLIRKYALSHQELTEKLKEIEIKFNHQFNDVYEAVGGFPSHWSLGISHLREPQAELVIGKWSLGCRYAVGGGGKRKE